VIADVLQMLLLRTGLLLYQMVLLQPVLVQLLPLRLLRLVVSFGGISQKTRAATAALHIFKFQKIIEKIPKLISPVYH